jgi:F420-non-reducing hydrogenase large subunit
VPSEEDIKEINLKLATANALVRILKSRAERLIETKSSLLRDFGKIDTQFLCLQQKKHLTLCDVDLELSAADGHVVTMTPREFSESIRERVRNYSFIKRPYLSKTGLQDGIIRVGPLARINRCQWDNTLLKKFEEVFSRPTQSTLAYNIARVIEIEECIKRMQEITGSGIGKHVRDIVKPRSGFGVGIVEAPRGLLFHYYSTDDQGIVKEANVITPTAVNASAIEKSAEAAARRDFENRTFNDVKREDLDRIEMVVRAYDPCLSCSVHATQIKRRK